MLDDCTGSGPFIDSVPVERAADHSRRGNEADAEGDQGLRRACSTWSIKLDGLPELKEQFMQPFQCAYLNGRPAILVCPNDYGCYWEVSSPPTALNPLGNAAHSETSPTVQKGAKDVYQISINWLFYALTH